MPTFFVPQIFVQSAIGASGTGSSYAMLVANGFTTGDSCRIRFISSSEKLWGWWNTFPCAGYAIDDIQCTGIVRDATTWTSLASNIPTTSYALTGQANGATRFRARAYANSAWMDWSDTTPITVTYSPMTVWRQTNFGTPDNIGTAADDADPDYDSLNNFIEYSLNGNPKASSLAALPVIGIAANRLTLTFNRTRAELTYIVEASNDLGTWSVIATNPGSAGQRVTATDTATLAGGKRFLRLKVTP